MISDIYIQDNVNQRECKRCGTCCKKGGPCLHSEDRVLLVKGVLGPPDLVTYRAGEMALNPLSKELVCLKSEMIKIRGDDQGTCIFFRYADNSCTIYENRPLECRRLKCWDTRDIEGLFLNDTLMRMDLIPEDSLLSELIKAYEITYSISSIWQLCRDSFDEGKGQSDRRQVLIAKDMEFRNKVMETVGIDQASCNFFFGRPVADIIAVFETILCEKRPKNE